MQTHSLLGVLSLLGVASLTGCATTSKAIVHDQPQPAPLADAPALVDVVSGEMVAVTDLAGPGQYTALHFLLKTECPLCLRHTWSYHDRAGETPEAVQVFIKPDSIGEIQAWLDETGDDAPTLYQDPDASLAEHLGVPDGYRFHGEVVHYPALIVLDPDGNEVFRHIGRDTTDRYPVARFQAFLAEQLAE